jgi:hypothetical protein
VSAVPLGGGVVTSAAPALFEVEPVDYRPRTYGPWLTVDLNYKGVLDIDTVKGCTLGMAAYPDGGCYGECYAAKGAARFGIDFTQSVSRRLHTNWHRSTLTLMMAHSGLGWYRTGTAGDPCHDWHNTTTVLRALWPMKMTPVVITKCWIAPTDDELTALRRAGAVVNISFSGLDTEAETQHRLSQRDRFIESGVKTVTRVVTCNYGSSEWARACADKQQYLLTLTPTIDNPLRARSSNPRVMSGEILLTRRGDSVGGGKLVSLHHGAVYLGKCEHCPDQCGVGGEHRMKDVPKLWEERVEYVYLPQVLGSGYEERVSTLALEDGIAHRAARKNMQIHSAIVCLINDEFVGFFTFQNNHELGEFCLLQSVIDPPHYTVDRYRDMVFAVLEQNTGGYPALITTDPKSKFETPKLFESAGFKTYLKMGGFHYMSTETDDLPAVRMKLLAHMTMVNVWKTTGGDWLRLKREWNEKINAAGDRVGVADATYATRGGCWQGTNGFANVVTGHAHNGNASVLDPVACEIILRFFMPTNGERVYNPFGGGVQFGYVTGAAGYGYVASEIRKNQCDANNLICSDFEGVEWVPSDSSTYHPDGMFDLVFTCPPYYRVEKYLDYDGQPPEGEINSLSTYEEFRDTLFAGYKIAIEHLNDGCFFVVMTGDSRDNSGAYYCSEAETELFLKEQGLSVYNRIVYVESAFTRMAQAKVTLSTRKFPKCEQKIIVAYKGDTSKIKDGFRPVGRL